MDSRSLLNRLPSSSSSSSLPISRSSSLQSISASSSPSPVPPCPLSPSPSSDSSLPLPQDELFNQIRRESDASTDFPPSSPTGDLSDDLFNGSLQFDPTKSSFYPPAAGMYFFQKGEQEEVEDEADDERQKGKDKQRKGKAEVKDRGRRDERPERGDERRRRKEQEEEMLRRLERSKAPVTVSAEKRELYSLKSLFEPYPTPPLVVSKRNSAALASSSSTSSSPGSSAASSSASSSVPSPAISSISGEVETPAAPSRSLFQLFSSNPSEAELPPRYPLSSSSSSNVFSSPAAAPVSSTVSSTASSPAPASSSSSSASSSATSSAAAPSSSRSFFHLGAVALAKAHFLDRTKKSSIFEAAKSSVFPSPLRLNTDSPSLTSSRLSQLRSPGGSFFPGSPPMSVKHALVPQLTPMLVPEDPYYPELYPVNYFSTASLSPSPSPPSSAFSPSPCPPDPSPSPTVGVDLPHVSSSSVFPRNASSPSRRANFPLSSVDSSGESHRRFPSSSLLQTEPGPTGLSLARSGYGHQVSSASSSPSTPASRGRRDRSMDFSLPPSHHSVAFPTRRAVEEEESKQRRARRGKEEEEEDSKQESTDDIVEQLKQQYLEAEQPENLEKGAKNAGSILDRLEKESQITRERDEVENDEDREEKIREEKDLHEKFQEDFDVKPRNVKQVTYPSSPVPSSTSPLPSITPPSSASLTSPSLSPEGLLGPTAPAPLSVANRAYFYETRDNRVHFNDVQLDIDPEATLDGDYAGVEESRRRAESFSQSTEERSRRDEKQSEKRRVTARLRELASAAKLIQLKNKIKETSFKPFSKTHDKRRLLSSSSSKNSSSSSSQKSGRYFRSSEVEESTHPRRSSLSHVYIEEEKEREDGEETDQPEAVPRGGRNEIDSLKMAAGILDREEIEDEEEAKQSKDLRLKREAELEALNQQTLSARGDHSIYKQFLRNLAKPSLALSEIGKMAQQLRKQTVKKMDQKFVHVNIEDMDPKEAKKLFLKVLAKGLFSCGLPMHVVEFYVTLAGQRLGLHVNMVSFMTNTFISFGADSTTHLVMAPNSTLSLSKMVDICLVSETIIRGSASYEDSLAAVQSIVNRKSIYHAYWFLPSMFFGSFFGTPLFSAGWLESIVGGLAGLAIGILELYSSSHSLLSLTRGHDLLAGLFASILASLTYSYVSQSINVMATCLGGIFWCLPGLRCTLAMTDLSTNNPVTGTAKLFSTILTLLNLGIGVAVGLQLQIFTNPDGEIVLISPSAIAFPVWSQYLFAAACSFPFMILLDAKSSHWLQLTAGSMVSFTVSTLMSNYLSSTFGTFMAAGVVGIMSNLYGRYTSFPSTEMYLYSIIMLVPGSVGVKSILANDTLSSLELFFQMLIICIAIVTGLFSANIIVPPIRSM